MTKPTAMSACFAFASFPSGGGPDCALGEITVLETIAVGRAIRDLDRLEELYGKGRWRKIKGKALVRLPSGGLRLVELHW